MTPISGGHALYFGCKASFLPDTVWLEPVLGQSEDKFPSLESWQTSKYYKLAIEHNKTYAQESNGLFFTTSFWGNQAADILALVRGTEQLYMDLIINPSWVKTAAKQMSDILINVHDEFMKYTASQQVTGIEGTANYCATWSPQKTLAFDCDVSFNISTEMYKTVFFPPLVEAMTKVDHRIYHLDGPGAIKHLDVLLDLPELHAIQWVQGQGKDLPIMQWVPLLKRILAKKKSVIAYCTPEEVLPLLKEVPKEGLCISTNCKTESEARKLVDQVSKT
jgi:hypothetical protein